MFGRSFFDSDPFAEMNRYFDDMDRYMASRMNHLFGRYENHPQMVEQGDAGKSDSGLKSNQDGSLQKHSRGNTYDLVFPRLAARSSLNAPFKMDVCETDKEFVVLAELPGTKKEDIQAKLEDSYLTISAERNHSDEFKDSTRHVVERSFGKFQRSLRLPETVDTENSSADFKDGVLTLKFVKKELDKSKNVKNITIQ